MRAALRKPWIRIVVTLGALVAAAVLAFVTWASWAAPPEPAAFQALESSPAVRVEQDPWLTFVPTGKVRPVGLILYPGGRVDPRAYAAAAHALAAEGFLTVIVPMPLNLAVFAPHRAADVMKAFPEIQAWAVGGHSLGGSMAANFAAAQPLDVEGLVLWAAYPAGSDDLSGSGLSVASIYGSLDGVAAPEEVLAGSSILPPESDFIEIAGGNHAQFGRYGPQAGDNAAAISADEQQAKVVASTRSLLERLEANLP
jgi:hypothetical protein